MQGVSDVILCLVEVIATELSFTTHHMLVRAIGGRVQGRILLEMGWFKVTGSSEKVQM